MFTKCHPSETKGNDESLLSETLDSAPLQPDDEDYNEIDDEHNDHGTKTAKKEAAATKAKAQAANADISGAGGPRESGGAVGATESSNYASMYKQKQWTAMSAAELKQAFKDNKEIVGEIKKIIEVIDNEVNAVNAAM